MAGELYVKAIECYREAADLGYGDARTKLESLCEKAAQTDEHAELRKAAEQGDAEAQYKFGELYREWSDLLTGEYYSGGMTN